MCEGFALRDKFVALVHTETVYTSLEAIEWVPFSVIGIEGEQLSILLLTFTLIILILKTYPLPLCICADEIFGGGAVSQLF